MCGSFSFWVHYLACDTKIMHVAFFSAVGTRTGFGRGSGSRVSFPMFTPTIFYYHHASLLVTVG
jgi:hypothetical protein